MGAPQGNNARPLIMAFVAGLLLAIALPQILLLTPFQLPTSTPTTPDAGGPGQGQGPEHGGSTTPPLLPAAMAMLNRPLQIARAALQRGPAAASTSTYYKSARVAASGSSSLLHSLHQSSSSSTRTFSTTPPTMASSKSFLQAIQDRRTIYALNKEAPISDEKIVSIAKDAVLHVPSSFNSQSTRLVVLLNEEHDKFWTYVLEVLKPIVPEDQFPSSEQRINGFKAGYGTILFFEDPEPVQALQKAFAIYAHHFPDWSEHTSAMHQYALWVALEAEGFGANLQHYNPLIDLKAQEVWNVPKDWKLRAQLVFGGKVADAGEKEFKPVEGERLFVHGAKK